MRPLQIVHAPTTVGGNPQGLTAAERELGQQSKSVALTQNYLNYSVDKVVFNNKYPWLFNEIKRWAAICAMLRNSDVVHYNFGQSLAPFVPTERDRHGFFRFASWAYGFFYASWAELLDVRLARLLGKVIAVTYQGDDARQGDYCRAKYEIHFAHHVGNDYYNDKSDDQKRRRIKRFAKLADLIYAVNPDLLNVLPEKARFVPYASVDPRAWKYVGADEDIQVPHIVHAPSNRDVKGSQYILNALERLKAEGIPFRFTLVEGYTNDDAKKVYETADILVDQLLAGYYGGLAVELMSLGKPVICYMRQSDLVHMPQKMVEDMPIIQAMPSTIYEVLKYYLTDGKKDLHTIGQQSRLYVEAWHDPIKIARSLVDDYLQIIKKKDR